MRISNVMGYALTASAVLTLLAGCSGGSSQMAATPVGPDPRAGTQAVQNGRLHSILPMHGNIVPGHRVTTPSFMDRDAVGKPLIFVVDQSNNVVSIFRQAESHKLVGQIVAPTGWFFFGVATDTARNLYLTNTSSISVYAPPYTGTPTTLQDGQNAPLGVAVSPAGVVGVANDCALPSCAVNTGSVTFYAPHSTLPCADVAVNASVQYATFDKEGNLFFGALYNPGGQQSYPEIGEIKGGCNAKKSELLTANNNLANALPMHIDKADRIAILDFVANIIYTYNHPKNGSLGNPVSTTPMTFPNGQIYDFAFVASGADLYTAEYAFSGSGLSNEYDYRRGGAPEGTTMEVTASGVPSGVAVTPPLVPRDEQEGR